jgi:hypothetical protein
VCTVRRNEAQWYDVYCRKRKQRIQIRVYNNGKHLWLGHVFVVVSKEIVNESQSVLPSHHYTLAPDSTDVSSSSKTTFWPTSWLLATFAAFSFLTFRDRAKNARLEAIKKKQEEHEERQVNITLAVSSREKLTGAVKELIDSIDDCGIIVIINERLDGAVQNVTKTRVLLGFRPQRPTRYTPRNPGLDLSTIRRQPVFPQVPINSTGTIATQSSSSLLSTVAKLAEEYLPVIRQSTASQTSAR